ncbi:MAG: hypothetical protein WCL49_01890 [bacterium]
MKAPLQNEVLDFLKQRLLPEIGEIRKDLDAFRVQTQAEFKVVYGRFDQLERRMDQIDKRMDQLDKRMDLLDRRMDQMTDEMREMRSYVFTTRMGETHYAVRDKPTR